MVWAGELSTRVAARRRARMNKPMSVLRTMRGILLIVVPGFAGIKA
jgi:hypothetical protein